MRGRNLGWAVVRNVGLKREAVQIDAFSCHNYWLFLFCGLNTGFGDEKISISVAMYSVDKFTDSPAASHRH